MEMKEEILEHNTTLPYSQSPPQLQESILPHDSALQSPLSTNSQSPSQPPAKRRKQKCYRKKVEKDWLQAETLKLIQEIEVRPSLWNTECPGYKLPKEILWQEVAYSVGMPTDECKGKWANLRTTYNSNRRKSLANEDASMRWKYFKSMLFLEANKFNQSTQSFKLEPDFDDSTFFENVDRSTPSSSNPEKCNRQKIKNPTPEQSYTSDSQSQSSFKQMTAEALQSISSSIAKPKNASTALCEYMDLELNSLTPEQAAYARSKLRHAFNKIMDEFAITPPCHLHSSFNGVKDY